MGQPAGKRLAALVGKRRKVQITRSWPCEPLHNGFVVGVGREWVLLHQFHDFYPEGYTAIRLADIRDIRSTEYERHWERMLAAEGLLEGIVTFDDLALDTTHGLLGSLRRRGEDVIVECEDRDHDIEDFYIGRILEVDARSVRFANFDGRGRWDPAPHVILNEEVTKIQFATPYVRTFSRYLAGPCPPLGPD